MTKQDFYMQEKTAITTLYKDLRSQKMKREEAFEEIQKKYPNYSTHTIFQIIYNPNYRNNKTEIMPKEENKA